ncbi:class I SAM-dependent DNA methyltransferase [Salinisphaera sp. P385]|uniref:site-specific DNA-methyltransferase (adenine-specific) n=1 Tax=Spectribacter acetivorans TaxID=3075603 RepID=A0ABU3B7V2_9GAMM|nr:class I SAM-dependent DNA methyltransferase [Salinisphaera sp. P385]MDT0618314.1 class I SAM-dependent DNA methyltransferase [Salinisphaera sp. P385]
MTEEDFKKTLWDTANALRGSVSAAEYKYPVLGLVFLKYVSDMFDAQAEVIRSRLADPKSDIYMDDEAIRAEAEQEFVTDRSFYDADNVFWVPKEAHYSHLLKGAAAAGKDLPNQLNAAMRAIEKENASLNGVLYRQFDQLELAPGTLASLMAKVAELKFDPGKHGSRDIFGEVYEYFLGEFARAEGAQAGEFYTPKSVVNLLVELLAPFRGKIYDPCCGSGGMFVQSAQFKEAHARKLGKKGDLPIYGQEMMAATRRLAKMNLAVHGLGDSDLGETYGSTFNNDQHPKLRADYILANPPFNISNWGGDKLTEDPRWTYGIPPKNNANYAWLQHMLARLSTHGRAGIVLANGSMTTNTSGEGQIRKMMIAADVVECMVALPGQLFSNTQIPVCLWFLTKDKKAGVNGAIDRTGQTLFIDARKMGSLQLSRTMIGFSDEEIHRIAQTYHRWRGTEFVDDGEHEDEPGFCKSADYAEIEKHGFVLTPGRYVGAAEVEDDDEAFEEKMQQLTGQLSELFAKGNALEDEVRRQLGRVGYEV